MNDKKTVSFGMALAIIFLPILVILLGGLVLRVGFLVPLMLATITASLLSIMAGFTWKEVEACIVNGVHRIIIVSSSSWARSSGSGFRPVSSPCSSTGA
ncbi:hypothetical protein [Bilophila wadsworthia]|uniref:hypothetical protein n=1 Tax=Bilophila wadsworthia TaxID=35833 RepID=UPI002665770C|nr:hypothetical protein [Bilophila wadsworthia]